MTRCSVLVLHLVFRLAVLVCWLDAMLSVADTRCLLLCADNVLASMLELEVHAARPGCRGRAYACLRLYAFDRDDVPCWPVQDVHQPIPVQRRIVQANRQRHQQTSALTVKGSTIWWLELFAPALSSQDLSQFTSSGHYEHAVFTLDQSPSALEISSKW